MNCYLSSILGLGLLGGSIATMTVTKEQHQTLKDVFSDDLDKKYDEIITERRNHYLIGIIVVFCHLIYTLIVTRGCRIYQSKTLTLS